jgi:predicted small secreted protein
VKVPLGTIEVERYSSTLSDYFAKPTAIQAQFSGLIVLAWIVLSSPVKFSLKRRRTMRSMIFAALMLTLLGMNMACNTVHGVGQDVERAGEKTQDAADAVKKKM